MHSQRQIYYLTSYNANEMQNFCISKRYLYRLKEKAIWQYFLFLIKPYILSSNFFLFLFDFCYFLCYNISRKKEKEVLQYIKHNYCYMTLITVNNDYL